MRELIGAYPMKEQVGSYPIKELIGSFLMKEQVGAYPIKEKRRIIFERQVQCFLKPEKNFIYLLSFF